MAQTQTATWYGASLKPYTYTVYPIHGTTWYDVPGNYIFAKMVNGGWYAIYVGETGSMRDRHANHDKSDCCMRNGATHIHAHVSNASDVIRRAEESDILATMNPWPPCNL